MERRSQPQIAGEQKGPKIAWDELVRYEESVPDNVTVPPAPVTDAAPPPAPAQTTAGPRPAPPPGVPRPGTPSQPPRPGAPAAPRTNKPR